VSGFTLALETDNELIRDYVSGKSERAATAFVRKHQSFVYATVLRYLQDYDEAEDAAQEVFIKALNNLHKFRGDSNIKTWLYRISVNICSNIKRKKKIFSIFKPLVQEDEEAYINIPATDITPDKQLENKEFEKNFMKILSKLPEKQRETFALRYFQEMTYEEISEMLGTSVGGLKANYFQAVKKLSEYLK
jgi:RNA polymerase sigma-70 factor, ECF subfamily